MNIIKHRKIYFSISSLLVVASIASIALFGLNLGIDFTGGSLMEIKVSDSIETNSEQIESIVLQEKQGEEPLLDIVRVQSTGDHGYLLRFKDVNQDQHQQILGSLNREFNKQIPDIDSNTEESDNSETNPNESIVEALDAQGNVLDIDFVPSHEALIESPVITIGGSQLVTELRFESVGPVVGEELKKKSIYAIISVILAIILYIAWAFRKVSDPVSSWKYGFTAIIALVHDVIIPTGVFVALGKIVGIEMDILFVTALLTILGFSVNDTIVVFDRTRENLSRDHHKHDFDWIVNKSVNETIRRSIFTSLTTFVVLFSIYLYGGDSIKPFVLALMIGLIMGTYSSIFLASPLLVSWFNKTKK